LALVHVAALHDEGDPRDRRDVSRRIAVERDEIGFLSRGERADRPVQVQRRRRHLKRRRPSDQADFGNFSRWH